MAKKTTKTNNTELREKGVQAASRFLHRRGYEILETHWSCSAGEADIIARDGDAVVFVEVKTRLGLECGFPSDAVDPKVRSRFEKVALAYLAEVEIVDVPIRFDVVAIVALSEERAVIRHHIGAFAQPDALALDEVEYKNLSDDAAAALKSAFHNRLRENSCDIAGSLADLVEDCLSAAIKEVQEGDAQ